jgi:HEAT repeat protein
VDDNKFVRAWAYSVLASIGEQVKTDRKRIASTLKEAENDEAASVRARVRQLRKRFPWVGPDR